MPSRGIWLGTDAETTTDATTTPTAPPIAGWLLEPSTPTDKAVVFLPPVGYASSSSHRMLRTIAEQVVQRGFLALRVDYPGTGDSGLEATDIADLERWRETLPRAAAWLRAQGISEIGIIGLEFGATLALLDGPAQRPTSIVAIAPVYRGRGFVRSKRLLGIPIPHDPDAVTSGGTYFSPGLCRAFAEIDLRALPEPLDRPTLLVEKSESITPSELAADPSIERWECAAIVDFLERPAEEALPDPHLAERIGDWVDQRRRTPFDALPEFRHPNGPSVALVGPTAHEEFVVIGRDELRGVLTRPAENGRNSRDLVVLLNSGSDPHTGPGRAWVELARFLTGHQWASLRVDLRGWGESPDGPSVPGRPYDAHASDDVVELVTGLRRSGWERIVLMGLCAGAWIALDAARSIELDGVVALNPQMYWEPGDPVEALMSTTRERRSAEIASIKADNSGGRWDAEDERGERPRAGTWLDDLSRHGVNASLLFAEGDDGLEYLRDRLAKRVDAVTEDGGVRIREIPEVDHAMHRTWLRESVYSCIAEELLMIRGARHC